MIRSPSRLARTFAALGHPAPYAANLHFIIVINGQFSDQWVYMDDITSLSWNIEGGSGGSVISTAAAEFIGAEPPKATTPSTIVTCEVNCFPLRLLQEVFGPFDPRLYSVFGSSCFAGFVAEAQATRRTIASPYTSRLSLSSRLFESNSTVYSPSDTSVPLAELIAASSLDNRIQLTNGANGIREYVDKYYPIPIRVITPAGAVSESTDAVGYCNDIGILVRQYRISHQENYNAPYADDGFAYSRRVEFIAPCHREMIAAQQIAAAPEITADLVLSEQPFAGRLPDSLRPVVVRTRPSIDPGAPWVEWQPPGFNPALPYETLDFDWCIDTTPPGLRSTGQVIADSLARRQSANSVRPTSLTFDLTRLIDRYNKFDRRAGYFAAYLAALTAGDAIALASDVNAAAPERFYIVEKTSHTMTGDYWRVQLDLVPVSFVTGRPLSATPYQGEPWNGIRWKDLGPEAWTQTQYSWKDI